MDNIELDAKIHSKRGIWYVTKPGNPVQRFNSEEEAIACVKGRPHEDEDDIYECEDCGNDPCSCENNSWKREINFSPKIP